MGLLASLLAPVMFDGFKVFDIDIGGKKDSVGDAIRKGAMGILNKVYTYSNKLQQ